MTNINLQPLPSGYLLHGRYRIGRILGCGGFGITYDATDTITGRHRAVKELFPQSYVTRGADRTTVCPTEGSTQIFEKMRSSFEKEIKVLIQLQDVQSAIQMYHAFSDNGTTYYVMEFLEGETLQQRMNQNGPMDWGTLQKIVWPIMGMLSKLHQAGVIHRDVSPDNIFLTRSGEVRLIDFGNARSFTYNQALTANIKAGFAPWEQFVSTKQQGPYTDVYSLCATTYFCLSGHVPQNVAIRIQNDQLTPLRQLCRGLPERLYVAVQHGLAIEARNRTQNMEALCWEMFGQELVTSPPPGGQPGKTQPLVKLEPAAISTTDYTNTLTVLPVVLSCLTGLYAGKQWDIELGTVFSIGRNLDCTLCYPANTRGVGRRQVILYAMAGGKVLARDDYATYRTMLITPHGTGIMERGNWYDVSGSILCFGAQERYKVTIRW